MIPKDPSNLTVPLSFLSEILIFHLFLSTHIWFWQVSQMRQFPTFYPTHSLLPKPRKHHLVTQSSIYNTYCVCMHNLPCLYKHEKIRLIFNLANNSHTKLWNLFFIISLEFLSFLSLCLFSNLFICVFVPHSHLLSLHLFPVYVHFYSFFSLSFPSLFFHWEGIEDIFLMTIGLWLAWAISPLPQLRLVPLNSCLLTYIL